MLSTKLTEVNSLRSLIFYKQLLNLTKACISPIPVIPSTNISTANIYQIITPTGVNDVKIAIKISVTYQIFRLN